jgi:hypothetical protein
MAMRLRPAVPLLALLTLAVAGHLAPARAATRFWTAAGSTGTVDEADTGLVAFSGANATFKASATGSAVLRYNVVAVDDLFSPFQGMYMTVRFRDNGADARVLVRLRRFDVVAGTTATLITVDSNAFGASSSWQVREGDNCAALFSFGIGLYYVEVEMTKSTTDGAPGVAAIVLAAPC